MFKWIKLNYSIINAETQAILFSCKCGNSSLSGNRVVLDTINTKGYWEYTIKCNHCNDNIYISKKKED